MEDAEFYDQNYVKKSGQKTSKAKEPTEKIVELMDTASGLSDTENDLDSTTHSLINGDAKSSIVEIFIEENAQNPAK